MAGKKVKVMRVRPRAAYRDQNDDAARRGMGQIIEVSEKVADNAKLMKREGYVRVTESKPEPTHIPPRKYKITDFGEPVEASKPEPQEQWEVKGGTEKQKQAIKDEGVTLPTDVDITDAAKALADEHFIDLAQVTGTGRGGKITKGDIQKIVDNG